MPKRPLQDIVPKRSPSRPRRSYDAALESDAPASEMPPARVRRPRREAPTADGMRTAQKEPVFEEPAETPPAEPEPPRYEPPRRPTTPFTKGRGGSRLWKMVAGIAVAVVVFAGGLSIVFSGATVTVYPHEQTAYIDGSFIATREPVPGQLSFEIMSIERTASKTVAATGETEAEERAAAELTIYNNFDEAPQRLIKNTRFESEEGLIFRIQESIEVPGMDGSTPGTIRVTVYAEEPGEEYNNVSGRFTIPGFKDTPRYETFYAEAAAPSAGGFVGIVRSASAADEAAARADLEAQLRNELTDAAFASSEKPEDYYLYDDAVFFEFISLPNQPAGVEQVKVTTKGVIHAVLLKKDEFARFVASQAIAGYDNERVGIRNPESITVRVQTLSEEETAVIPWENESIRLLVEGNPHIVWEFDRNRLAEDLTGRNMAALETVLSGYPGIDRARAVIRPFWKRSFPEEASEITIIESLEDN